MRYPTQGVLKASLFALLLPVAASAQLAKEQATLLPREVLADAIRRTVSSGAFLASQSDRGLRAVDFQQGLLALVKIGLDTGSQLAGDRCLPAGFTSAAADSAISCVRDRGHDCADGRRRSVTFVSTASLSKRRDALTISVTTHWSDGKNTFTRVQDIIYEAGGTKSFRFWGLGPLTSADYIRK
jgi:hypothetical protein